MLKKRTTIYLEDRLIKMLKLRSIKSEQSTSEYISQVVYQDLLEEQEDLADIQKVMKEPTISFETMIEKLDLKDEISN